MYSSQIKHHLTLLLALWLGLGSAAFALDTCPESHACCKSAKKKLCCGESQTPVAPAPVCQCSGEVAQPLAGSRTVEAAKRGEAEPIATPVPQQAQSWSYKPSRNVVSQVATAYEQVGHIAPFRLTLRWRC